MQHFGEWLDAISITVDASRVVWEKSGHKWVSWGAPILVLAREVTPSDPLDNGTPDVFVFVLSGATGELAEVHPDGLLLPVGTQPPDD